MPALILVRNLTLLTHEFDRIAYHLHLDVLVDLAGRLDQAFLAFQSHQNVQRRVVVDLKDPGLKLAVDEHIKANHLEAFSLGLMELAIELKTLLFHGVGLDRDQTLTTDI